MPATVLPRGATEDLIRLVQSGDQAAAAALIQANEGLLRQVAGSWLPLARSLEFEDLCQEGRIALLFAARKFSLGRGVCFSTLAVVCLRRAVRRAVQKQGLIRLPRERFLDPDLPSAILCEPAGEAGRDDALDALPDTASVDWEEQLIERLTLEDALAELSEPERIALLARHVEGETYRAVSARVHVSRETARKLEGDARAKLRDRLAGEGATGEQARAVETLP